MSATATPTTATEVTAKWWARPVVWAELFAISNLAFLAVDIYVAHSANNFGAEQGVLAAPAGSSTVMNHLARVAEHPSEWVPVYFSAAVTPLLLLAMLIGGSPEPAVPGQARGGRRLARWLGLLVGWGSIVVGVAGLVLHLNADFFQLMTIKNLVYTTPFAAPLAYTGLGFLLILNRSLDGRSVDWARWVALLAAGGFLGNFVLCLADHAQNGFFLASEWTGVIAGAVGFGFLMSVVIVPGNRSLLGLTGVVMLAQVVVALVGFYLHARANLTAPSENFWDRLVYGAPIFAPLLFADLALLGLLGLWAQFVAAGRKPTAR
jgi:hypothetical protein